VNSSGTVHCDENTASMTGSLALDGEDKGSVAGSGTLEQRGGVELIVYGADGTKREMQTSTNWDLQELKNWTLSQALVVSDDFNMAGGFHWQEPQADPAVLSWHGSMTVAESRRGGDTSMGMEQTLYIPVKEFDTDKLGVEMTMHYDGNSWGPLKVMMPAAVVVESAQSTQSTLSIPLNAGWTWISFPLISDDMSISQMLTGDFDNGDMLKSNSAFTTFYPNHGWFGTLNTIDTNQGYAIKCSAAQTFTMKGYHIPMPSSLAIQVGWNWIGVHFPAPADLTNRFVFSNVAAGDLLKSQSSFTTYYEGHGWFGTLSTLDPGTGYKLKASRAGTLTFEV